MEQVFEKIFEKIKKEPTVLEYWEDGFECIKILYQDGEKSRAFKLNRKYRAMLDKMRGVAKAELLLRMEELRKETYHIEAYDIFDSYLIYLEWDRASKKKFYLPRREILRDVVKDLQDLEDGKIEFLGVSLPPRVGKSTLCIMFLTWVMGRRPECANLMSGHSDKLTNGFYKEVLSIITDEHTYNWSKVFPNSQVVETSAKNETIDLDSKKRFCTLTCRSVSGTLTGAVEIGNGGYLYCDDLVEDLEEAISPERMQNKYDAYLNQLKDRKKDGAKELMIGTRWNVFDPLGRISQQYEGNSRYRFRIIPALNDNDESNFDYPYQLGFSTRYYKDMRESIDDATWWAKYMGQPYMREGLVFPQGELLTYNGDLPPNPDRRLAVVDVAWGGGDFLSMPIAYVYGDEIYIHDVVFNKSNKEITQPLVAGKIIAHGLHQVEFEANNGGNEYRDAIDQILKGKAYVCNLSSKRAPNNMNKLARIIQYTTEIKRFYFLAPSKRHPEYQAFINNLCLFTMNGKNKNDDAPDSLAMLVTKLNSTINRVEIFDRPF